MFIDFCVRELCFAHANAQTKNCKRASTFPTLKNEFTHGTFIFNSVREYFVFQNIFPTLKKIKHPNAQTNTTKKNDTETQQRQWFTDTEDKNASTQQRVCGNSG